MERKNAHFQRLFFLLLKGKHKQCTLVRKSFFGTSLVSIHPSPYLSPLFPVTQEKGTKKAKIRVISRPFSGLPMWSISCLSQRLILSLSLFIARRSAALRLKPFLIEILQTLRNTADCRSCCSVVRVLALRYPWLRVRSTSGSFFNSIFLSVFLLFL